MKSSTPFRAALGAIALAATGTMFAVGSAAAQSSDQLLGTIEQGCVSVYDANQMSGISAEQHGEVCGCMTRVLGESSLSTDQLGVVAALFSQDVGRAESLAGNLSDSDTAGLDAALAKVSEDCVPAE